MISGLMLLLQQIDLHSKITSKMNQQSEPSVEDVEENSSVPSPIINNQIQTEIKKKPRKKKTAVNITVNLIDTQYPVVKKVVKGMLGFKVIRDSSNNEWDLYWTDNAVSSQQLSKMKAHQKINHFPGMYTLSRKNYLARNLIKMEKKFPNDYNFFPKTWVLPSELNQFRNFMQNDPNAIVIAKPQASSQGRGIFLSRSIDDFQFGEHYVVQKYLKKPFLIDGLKFDLRVYVLVGGCDPLRLYIYKEGLARFATEPYCTPKKENLNNLYMHLTNYAINKNSEKFQFNNSATEMNKGHKRSLTSILIKLQQLGHSRQKVWQQIKDCIAKTMISAQPLLAHHYRSSQPNNYANNMCFQILGFDIILDCNLKPEVLEVNYTPSFTTDTPLDQEIKKNLIHDALVLMNLTNKAKRQIVNQKKKQMKERTLTGKNFYLSRQSRQNITDKCQQDRNLWENKHLGNYQRILPVNIKIPQKIRVKIRVEDPEQEKDEKQQFQMREILNEETQYKEQFQQFQQNKHNVQEKQKNSSKKQLQKTDLGLSPNKQLEDKYNKFLDFSLECYQHNTGANVRRNNKVAPQHNSTGQGLSIIAQQNQANQNLMNNGNNLNNSKLQTLAGNTIKQSGNNQPIKFTNTENLEKIYKCKFRPMIYKKGSQNGQKKPKDEEVEQKMTNMTKLESYQGSQSEYIKAKTPNPYASVYPGIDLSKFKQKGKASNEKQREAFNFKNLSSAKTKTKTLQDPSKNNGKRKNAQSLKKGLSTVYNLTFQDKKE